MQNVHIMTASPDLAPHEGLLRSLCDDTFLKLKAIIELPEIDVMIAHDPDNAITETSFGGEAPTANLLYIYVDARNENFIEIAKRELPSTLAHEAGHCVRQTKYDFHKNLLEQLIAEGLSDHFDNEVTGSSPKPWSVALSSDELNEMKSKAEQEWENESFDHAAWFFGSESRGIKKWTGYALGYALVGEYIKHRGKKASELLLISPREIIG